MSSPLVAQPAAEAEEKEKEKEDPISKTNKEQPFENTELDEPSERSIDAESAAAALSAALSALDRDIADIDLSGIPREIPRAVLAEKLIFAIRAKQDCNVRVLDLMFCELGFDGRLEKLRVALSGKLAQLETLGLGCNAIGNASTTAASQNEQDSSTSALFALRSILQPSATPSLTRLFLFQNALGDEGVRALCETLAVHDAPLTLLGLGDNQISTAGAIALAELLRPSEETGACPGVGKTLSVVLLRLNRIGNAGVRALARSIAYNQTLRTLDLRYNGLTVAIIEPVEDTAQGTTGCEALSKYISLRNFGLVDVMLQEDVGTWSGEKYTSDSQNGTDNTLALKARDELESRQWGTVRLWNSAADHETGDSNDCDCIKLELSSVERNRRIAESEIGKLVLSNRPIHLQRALRVLAGTGMSWGSAVVDGVSPLHFACALGKIECAKIMLSLPGIPWSLENKTPSGLSCAELSSGDMARWIVKQLDRAASKRFPNSHADVWNLVSSDASSLPALPSSGLYHALTELFVAAHIYEDNAARYARLFESQNIDTDLLDDLDDTSLIALGIGAWGDRQKILKQLGKHELCSKHGQAASQVDSAREYRMNELTDWILQEGIVGTHRRGARALAERIAEQEIFLGDFADSNATWSADDLRSIGVDIIGQQKRILMAIQRLKLRNAIDTTLLIRNVKINTKARLGAGVSGIVFRGMLASSTTVACKMLYSQGNSIPVVTGNSDSDVSREFFNEVQTLSKLRHPNVLQFFGVHLDERGRYFIVMELMDLGDLQSLLAGKNRSRARSAGLALNSLAGKLKALADIAAACAYLETKHIVHRDIAARNVLVSGEGVSKLADFGLGRSLGGANAYEYAQSTRSALPFRTTAPEALRHKRFSSKSDCWAFGCLIWQVIHEKTEIFPEWSAHEVLRFLESGERLQFASQFSSLQDCPPALVRLMHACWFEQTEQRPTFTDVCASLARLQNDGQSDEGSRAGQRTLGLISKEYIDDDWEEEYDDDSRVLAAQESAGTSSQRVKAESDDGYHEYEAVAGSVSDAPVQHYN